MRDRALLLRSQDIHYHQAQRHGHHVLLVEEAFVERALHELADYEADNHDWPPRDVLPPPLPGTRVGALAYLALIGGVHLLAVFDALALGWYEHGAAAAERIRAGELWRAVTALTLHTGPVHLVSNAIFGVLFGFSAAYSFGGGLAWCAILLAGALGNLTNAWVVSPEHVSVGASTAVFAAVGLLGGSEWRRRNLLRQRRLRRAAPIVMVLLLLALHGVQPEPSNVDIGAHLFGLLWGVLLGALLPSLLAHGWGARRGQRLGAMLALLSIVLAWTLALRLAP